MCSSVHPGPRNHWEYRVDPQSYFQFPRETSLLFWTFKVTLPPMTSGMLSCSSFSAQSDLCLSPRTPQRPALTTFTSVNAIHWRYHSRLFIVKGPNRSQPMHHTSRSKLGFPHPDGRPISSLGQVSLFSSNEFIPKSGHQPSDIASRFHLPGIKAQRKSTHSLGLLTRLHCSRLLG
jgi:hypothetical protein